MKELNTMTLDELKALEAEIKVAKANLKEQAKVGKADANQAKVDEVNAMIDNGTLKVGMNIVILYGSKNEELTGTIVGVLNKERASITVESVDFASTKGDTGLKRRYIDKARFVRVAD